MLNQQCSIKVLTTSAHAAILRTTHDLATSSANTPAQLLGLQRLADFPARADYRTHKKEMDLHRKHINTERHQLALQKHAHKLEMDIFRKHITTERLGLAKQSLALKEKLATARQPHPPNHPATPAKDSSSPGISDFGPRISDLPPLEPFPSDETLARLRVKRAYLYSHGSDYRNYIPQCARARSMTVEQYLIDIVKDREAFEVREAARRIPASPAGTTSDNDPIFPFQDQTAKSPAAGDPQSPPQPSKSPTQNAEIPSAPDPFITASSITNSQFSIFNSQSGPEHNPQNTASDLFSAVDSYTTNRAKEYWSYRRNIASSHPSENPPEYITQYRHCPCGSATPCPIHENETYGPFPSWFWSRSPHSPHYAACLRDRGLPYRDPQEFL